MLPSFTHSPIHPSIHPAIATIASCPTNPKKKKKKKKKKVDLAYSHFLTSFSFYLHLLPFLAMNYLAPGSIRFNEREFSHFAAQLSGRVKEGYLQKRGEGNTSFKQRYFVLKANFLIYYKTSKARRKEKKNPPPPMEILMA